MSFWGYFFIYCCCCRCRCCRFNGNKTKLKNWNEKKYSRFITATHKIRLNCKKFYSTRELYHSRQTILPIWCMCYCCYYYFIYSAYIRKKEMFRAILFVNVLVCTNISMNFPQRHIFFFFREICYSLLFLLLPLALAFSQSLSLSFSPLCLSISV